ncbi:MAG: hypothetical protein PHP50_11050 [Lachnospiraceae bacterium]|nr:hypothetical protein [Lachnospiraceae bacterium]
MNVNDKLNALKQETGLNVYPDVAPVSEKDYFVYTYEDERPAAYGDDCVTADIAYIQLSLYTQLKTEYMDLKHKARDYLESSGFCVTSIQSWVDDTMIGTDKTRHTVFEINYTEARKEREE